MCQNGRIEFGEAVRGVVPFDATNCYKAQDLSRAIPARVCAFLASPERDGVEAETAAMNFEAKLSGVPEQTLLGI